MRGTKTWTGQEHSARNRGDVSVLSKVNEFFLKKKEGDEGVILEKLKKNPGEARGWGGLIHVDNDNIRWYTPGEDKVMRGFYGGSKALEINVAIGAFNYLEIQEFCKHLTEKVPWKEPEQVQLLLAEQEDGRFGLYQWEDIKAKAEDGVYRSDTAEVAGYAGYATIGDKPENEDYTTTSCKKCGSRIEIGSVTKKVTAFCKCGKEGVPCPTCGR